jgi:hypothetical protein
MAQIIPNAALIKGTVAVIEEYEAQQGFQLITMLISHAGEKEGNKFLGNDILNTEIKVLVSETVQKKLHLKPKSVINGEIKKVNPQLWRASEDTWQLSAPAKAPDKKD